jgi:hypothetical protein
LTQDFAGLSYHAFLGLSAMNPGTAEPFPSRAAIGGGLPKGELEEHSILLVAKKPDALLWTDWAGLNPCILVLISQGGKKSRRLPAHRQVDL